MTRDNITELVWKNKTVDGRFTIKITHTPGTSSNPATNAGHAGTPGDGSDTEDFITALNNEVFGGFSDWRLPTVKELATLLNYSKRLPAIDTLWFPNTDWRPHWSSNTAIDDARLARIVGFQYGGVVGADLKSAVWYRVRAVRGGPLNGGGTALVDNNDGTITDTQTGLMWQKETAPGTYTWEQAFTYAEELSLGGYTDWRLPNINELISRRYYSRFNPSIHSLLAQHTVSTSWEESDYWSSTTFLDSPSNFDNASFVYFYNGSAGGDIYDTKYEDRNVRVVRGDKRYHLLKMVTIVVILRMMIAIRETAGQIEGIVILEEEVVVLYNLSSD